MCHLDHLLQLPWADSSRAPPTEAARSKYILRVTSVAAPVKISPTAGRRRSVRRPKPFKPQRQSLFSVWPGCSSATLRRPASLRSSPDSCPVVRNSVAHPAALTDLPRLPYRGVRCLHLTPVRSFDRFDEILDLVGNSSSLTLPVSPSSPQVLSEGFVFAITCARSTIQMLY
jgi:hypothetical protein